MLFNSNEFNINFQMGTCFVQNNKKPTTRPNPTINNQVNLAVNPTTPNTPTNADEPSQQTQVLKQKQLNNVQTDVEPNPPELNPLEDMNKKDSNPKPQIRPTNSVFMPEYRNSTEGKRGSGYQEIIVSSEGSSGSYINRGSDLPEHLPSKTITKKEQFGKKQPVFASNFDERHRTVEKQNQYSVEGQKSSKVQPQSAISEVERQKMVRTTRQQVPQQDGGEPNGVLWNTMIFKI